MTASYAWEISFSGDATGSKTQTLTSTERVTVGELQSVATTSRRSRQPLLEVTAWYSPTVTCSVEVRVTVVLPVASPPKVTS